ncbi:MAG TPA: DUF418 domain-containing protein [Allosphingosinicella sp.]|jgi:uncharacterized protein|nr:DUF418 domain-containing protein [Allosphingosinicella sp.]
MTAATEPPPRIATLDIVRGVAVMGILAMNIVAFGMVPAAYVNPNAWGTESGWDLASWAFSFVFIDGKMRGLFSFLFGASLLLVIQKAEAKGESPASVHFRRMLWLLLFGWLHFLFIWYGDILTGYASIGLVAWFFRDMVPRRLILWGVVFVLLEFALMSAFAARTHELAATLAEAPGNARAAAELAEMSEGIATPSAAKLGEQMRLFLGPWSGIVQSQLTEHWSEPLFMLFVFGWETLGYMLLGMAALKNGFLTGEWEDGRYRKVALTGLAIAVPAYALLAWLLARDGFTVPGIFTFSFAGTVLIRPVAVAAIAALIILLTRRGGALTQRIAAAGRAAFTNYLGTSILMTALFYGWGVGLFGRFTRIELWLVVFAMWALMLAWSKPWLERHRYGPFEWLWRSLARWQWQEMRKPAQARGRTGW